MVMQNSVMKYITRIGQKTGMLKNSKKVQKKAMRVALVAEYQNLNSGRRRMKGRNSSDCFVGSWRPSSAVVGGKRSFGIKASYRVVKKSLSVPSSASYSANAGSILGVRKARRRFK